MSTISQTITPSTSRLSGIKALARRHWKSAIFILILAGAAVGGAQWWKTRTGVAEYTTGKIARGNIEVDVTATGTVQAVTTVQVGTQVSGTVSWLGADFKSTVKKGQVVAKLDPALFQSQVDIAKANLINAQAGVTAATTDVGNQGANVEATKANELANKASRDDAIALAKQNEQLRGVLSDREVDASAAQAQVAIAHYNQATAQINQSKAGVQTSQAKVLQAKAAVQQAQAQLDQANINLEHTIITSPIDGVVVSRSVDVGQTVSASLSAPTLFTIANDLTSMQVLASVDEADVGQIKEGGDANFSVDAYPGGVFHGKINQLRLNAQALQNVVTYTAVIDVSNPDQKLLPGMTANITFPVQTRENTLTVPNAALRFKPAVTDKPAQQAATGSPQAGTGQRQQRGNGGGAGQDGGNKQSKSAQPAADGSAPQTRRQTIYVLTATNTLEPRVVQIGITDGRVTEIVSGDLQEGEVVVTGQNDAGSAKPAPTATSPFNQRTGGAGGGRGGR